MQDATLTDILWAHGMPHTGDKAALVERISTAVAAAITAVMRSDASSALAPPPASSAEGTTCGHLAQGLVTLLHLHAPAFYCLPCVLIRAPQ